MAKIKKISIVYILGGVTFLLPYYKNYVSSFNFSHTMKVDNMVYENFFTLVIRELNQLYFEILYHLRVVFFIDLCINFISTLIILIYFFCYIFIKNIKIGKILFILTFLGIGLKMYYYRSFLSFGWIILVLNVFSLFFIEKKYFKAN